MKSLEEHLCHARPLCSTPVKPALLFCKPHWAMVPREMQREHWRVFGARYSSNDAYKAFLDSMERLITLVQTEIGGKRVRAV